MRAVVIAAAVAFLVSLLGTPLAIKGFTRLRFGQPIRIDGPQTHLVKRGTPTMGGVVFIVATLIAYVAGHLSLSSLPTAQIAQVGPTMTALVLLGVFTTRNRYLRPRGRLWPPKGRSAAGRWLLWLLLTPGGVAIAGWWCR